MSDDIGLRRVRQLTVGDIMSRHVVVIPESSAMHNAAYLLADQAVSAAPVVDDAGRCVGALSAADFITFEIERTGDVVDAHACRCHTLARGEYVPWNSVRKFMSTAVQTVACDTPLLKASEIMCAEHIHRLYVLNDRSVPIGVISTLDLVAALVNVDREQSQLLAAKSRSRRNNYEQVH